MKPVRVLFGCLGNSCRSPTAHGVFENMARTEGLGGFVTVDSAGTGHWRLGRGPDQRAIRAAQNRGYDLRQLCARQVGAEDFDLFEHILAMDLANLADLQALAPPHFSGEPRLFPDYADCPEPAQVPDPYGGGIDGFERMSGMIETASQGLIPALKDRLIAHKQLLQT